MSKFHANDAKFAEVRALNLPASEYAITSSGPLGIREIRQIGDIDLVLSDALWSELAERYPAETRDGVTTLRISENIEALGSGSVFAGDGSQHPSIAEQIEQAETIDRLPFVNLKHILYFKQLMNRPKDAADIVAIKVLCGLTA